MDSQRRPNDTIVSLRNGREMPSVIVTAMPEWGHTMPMLQIAAHLVRRGYPVFFCGGPQFEAQIRASGAEYYECPNYVTPDLSAKLRAMPEGPERRAFGLKHVFIDSAPTRLRALTRCMADVRERFPRREVVLIDETLFLGTWPLWLGAPLPKGYDRMPPVVGFNSTFVLNRSVDVAPFLEALPPAESEADREKIRSLYEKRDPLERELSRYAMEVMRSLGATREMTFPWIVDDKSLANDVLLVGCTASLDLPRSDLDPKIKYCGGLPLKALDSNLSYPDWWEDVRSNAELPPGDPEKKRIVVVTQGTVRKQYENLLIPAIQALKDRADVLVVALLGAKEAVLPEEILIPKNTRVVDYLPYDAILPYADVLVFNAGFGGFMHGVMNGVPMIMAGTTEDKAEVSLRGERAGLGISLKTSTPSVEAIREAVDRILENAGYKERAEELKKENEATDILGSVEEWIWRLLDLPN